MVPGGDKKHHTPDANVCPGRDVGMYIIHRVRRYVAVNRPGGNRADGDSGLVGVGVIGQGRPEQLER
jgi:hypothetical protein